jgi:hypothetical protein
MENRRLLMSILFLKPFAIVLASQAAKWQLYADGLIAGNVKKLCGTVASQP